MKNYLPILMVAILLAPTVGSSMEVAETKVAATVDASSLGLVPDDKADATESFAVALAYSLKNNVKTLKLAKGVYHFYPERASSIEYYISNTTNTQPSRKIPIQINGFKDFTLDGSGSEFIFHGNVTPLVIDQSHNVQLRNFSMDWERPFISQMVVSQVGSNFVEFAIDPAKYPYEIRNNVLWFTGEGWAYKAGIHIFVDAKSDIEEGTIDDPMGEEFFESPAKQMSPGKFRIYGRPLLSPKQGTRVVARHGKGDNVGLFIYRSSDIQLNGLKVYHAPGKAILAQRCENIKLDGSSITINQQKERWFSSYADAMHFSGCKGNISVKNADNIGQMDDWFNVHGTYTSVEKVENKNTFVGKFHHHESRNLLIFEKGDRVAILDQHTGLTQSLATVESFELMPPESYRLRIQETLPAAIKVGNVIENQTWHPSVEISDSKIRRANRARGLLITTPKPVKIHHNYFASAGSPILIEGDFYHWYESGAVQDFEVSHNTFDRTFTSGVVKAKTVDDDGGYYWGDASIVSITPTFKSTLKQPTAFHRNIRIHDNEITALPVPLVYARAVGSLHFTRNKINIVNLDKFKGQPLFYFESSNDIKIQKNEFKGLSTPKISFKNMGKTDFSIQPELKLDKVN
jgi:hypothetical protein